MDENTDLSCFSLLKTRFGKESWWDEVVWEDGSNERGLKIVESPALSHDAVLKKSVVSFCGAFEEARKLRGAVLKKNEVPPAAFELLNESCILEDWNWFCEEFLKVSEPQQIINDANWVWDASPHVYFLCIGQELLWLLGISRCLGLIEFEKLRHLRNMKITVLGASVAASTVDLLVSLGCQNITCIDPGIIDPSNIPRLPNGDISNVGASKSQLLISQLSHRNPYGNFTAVQGKLIANEHERTSQNDVILEEFLQDTDLVIEVIDDVKMKILTQQFSLKNKHHHPTLFIADVGNEPIVRFIKSWSDEEKEIYQKLLNERQPNPKLAAASIFTMVKNDLPTEHAAQFLLSCLGVIPFWSQTPVASRLSSGMAALEILKSIKVKGKTLEPIQENPKIISFCEKILHY